MVPVLASIAVLLASASGLDALEAKLHSVDKESDWSKRSAVYAEIEPALNDLINGDKLHTPEELRRASLILGFVGQDFQSIESQYELMLAAAAGGDEPAREGLGKAWDRVLVAMSRGRRIGAEKMEVSGSGERYRLVPTQKVILGVYLNPKTAIATAKSTKNDTELQKIVDADQAARQGDWSKMTPKDFAELAKMDSARLARVKLLVHQGRPKTADDFFNAALVCQHGATFDDYALAHELSVCGMILGSKDSSWLAGASYDRMLFQSGHPQRFATQYSIMAGVTKLSRYDTTLINDTMRKLVVHHTLDFAIERKF